MLEIICAGSLVFSISTCQDLKSTDLLATNQVTTSDIINQNISQQQEYLAKGKKHESRYRREADRQIDELRYQDRGDRDYRDRFYRDSDQYRRGREYGDDYRGRIYRDPDQRGREIEYDEYDDRYYIPQRSRNRYFRRGR